MVEVIKSPTVNVVPSECYHAPDGDANRDGVLQICPKFITCKILIGFFLSAIKMTLSKTIRTVLMMLMLRMIKRLFTKRWMMVMMVMI
jgi:hypothetical protein